MGDLTTQIFVIICIYCHLFLFIYLFSDKKPLKQFEHVIVHRHKVKG